MVKDLELVVNALNWEARWNNKTHVDISKIIIIDNLVESFQLQPANGIKIRDWYGVDISDTALMELVPALKDIVKSGSSDVRVELAKLRQAQPHYKQSYASVGGLAKYNELVKKMGTPPLKTKKLTGLPSSL